MDYNYINTMNFTTSVGLFAAIVLLYCAPGVYAAYKYASKTSSLPEYILHLIGGSVAMPVYLYLYLAS